VWFKPLATLSRFLPPGTQGSACKVELPDRAQVAELLACFNIPVDGSLVILVNGLGVDSQRILEENETVAVFQAIAGG